MKYECMILCPDSNSGYLALHEAVQDGWEPMLSWTDKHGTSILLRRLTVECGTLLEDE